jgi:hypothetical protein
MKSIFPGHYELAPNELRELWKEAVFVFDTNVLLNLYRYPQVGYPLRSRSHYILGSPWIPRVCRLLPPTKWL